MKTINETQISKIIKTIYDKNPEKFVLVQIGANDGWMCDRMNTFVLENDPKAILVEPIPCYFDVLRTNYKNNKNITFVNKAIDSKKGQREMFYIEEQRFQNEEVRFRMENTPHLFKEHWARGLGSFYNDKNNLACPELKSFSSSIIVETLTFEELLEQNNITPDMNIVVQTDCEGHDFELLKTFNFEKFSPVMYISEIYHLVRYPLSHPKYRPHPTRGYIEYRQPGGMYTEKEELAAISIFEENGYILFRSNDMIAIKNSLGKFLK
jgi:FkbM family methyltransferase